LPNEDSTPPVIKMILVFTSPYIYLPNLDVKLDLMQGYLQAQISPARRRKIILTGGHSPN
jgi:hypothetical protein